jgi:tetratricopeptide (TPR) repeat protein
VALTDPELDLLREMLVDSPSEDVFLEVGEELVRRLRWAEAEQVLVGGLADVPEGDPRRSTAMALLARAALETGRYDLCTSALSEIDTDPTRAPEHARVQLLCLERSGRLPDARALAERFLALDPGDVVAQAVLDRLDLPPPTARTRGADPFYTVDRAERYVDIGRPDRAVRVLRRILAHVMAHDPVAGADTVARLEQRIRQLAADVHGGMDDLSEELTDPGLLPEAPEPDQADVYPQLVPRIVVPAPQVAVPLQPAGAPDGDGVRDGVPDVASELADYDDDQLHTTEETLAADDEITDLQVARGGNTPSTSPTVVPAAVESNVRERRKRRSLLRR